MADLIDHMGTDKRVPRSLVHLCCPLTNPKYSKSSSMQGLGRVTMPPRRWSILIRQLNDELLVVDTSKRRCRRKAIPRRPGDISKLLTRHIFCPKLAVDIAARLAITRRNWPPGRFNAPGGLRA